MAKSKLIRSKLYDVIEFAHLMAREYPGCSPFDVDRLMQLAKRHGRAAVAVCNAGLGKDVAWMDRLEGEINELCAEIGCNVKLGGDPRGFTVKLLLPSKRSNTWGGEEDGWGVPQ